MTKRRADVILIAVLLLVSAAAFLVFRVVFSDEGSYITVTAGGQEYGRYALSKDCEIPVVIDGRTTNVIVIEDGKAYMNEASCPDHLCILQGEISQSKESIVCLPNQVVVTAEGKDGTFDAVVQ